jgi:hypothetical protein
MSEEGSFGLSAVQRILGLLVFAMGLITVFYALTSALALESFMWFFTSLGIILSFLGLVMITAKTTE